MKFANPWVSKSGNMEPILHIATSALILQDLKGLSYSLTICTTFTDINLPSMILNSDTVASPLSAKYVWTLIKIHQHKSQCRSFVNKWLHLLTSQQVTLGLEFVCWTESNTCPIRCPKIWTLFICIHTRVIKVTGSTCSCCIHNVTSALQRIQAFLCYTK